MKDENQLTVEVKSGEIMYLPRFVKNAKGEQELYDKSFQIMIDHQFLSEKSANEAW